ACTQVCPSGAIPHLTLEEKRRAPIGIVVIDRDKCIDCMICEDACPASAIEREEYFGKYRNLKARPVVNPDLCTGCNRCTFDCPMECMTVVSRKIANA
ncbi:MAG TPA: 4Fe-4S dicluster domain-containing protein, partial [Aggregatilineales bacterium]|nr:4Fe-4S dicluster domain-containing protein [Aggregatilineales bacterium]